MVGAAFVGDDVDSNDAGGTECRDWGEEVGVPSDVADRVAEVVVHHVERVDNKMAEAVGVEGLVTFAGSDEVASCAAADEEVHEDAEEVHEEAVALHGTLVDPGAASAGDGEGNNAAVKTACMDLDEVPFEKDEEAAVVAALDHPEEMAQLEIVAVVVAVVVVVAAVIG